MNVVTPEFVKARGLAAGSIQDLNNHAGRIPINGAGGKRTEPLGYVMIGVCNDSSSDTVCSKLR